MAKPGSAYQQWFRLSLAAGSSRIRPTLPSLLVLDRPCTRSFSSTSSQRSGHNRWSKIKHKKGAADMQRGAQFSRVTQEITNALRPPKSPDPINNIQLAHAMAKAKSVGMTKIQVDNVLRRAQSVADGSGQSLTYEVMGPTGKDAYIMYVPPRLIQTPLVVLAHLDSYIKSLANRHHCRISPVGFLFEKKGLVVVSPTENGSKDFDDFFEIAIEGGAEDIEEVEGDEDGIEWEAQTSVESLQDLTSFLSSPPHTESFEVRSSDVVYLPLDPITIDNGGASVKETQAETLMKFPAALEADPDVVKVWTNFA